MSPDNKNTPISKPGPTRPSGGSLTHGEGGRAPKTVPTRPPKK